MAFNVRAFPVLRLAGVVLGTAALTAAGIAYWLFVSEQRQYLIGRDFRVLSSLATQIDNVNTVEAAVVSNAAAATADDSSKLKAKWFALRGKPFRPEDIKLDVVESRTASLNRPDYKFRFDGETLRVPLQSKNDTTRAPSATIRLQPVLEPMFVEKVVQGAFESILLSDRSGRILLSAGDAATQIRSSGLGILSATGADGKPMPFFDIAQSIGTASVSFADVDYTLFTFPCCGANTVQPLVLVGLIRTDGLRSNSWAISTTIVKSIVLGLLLAVVSWPFLKLILLGDRQKVRSSDFLQLGASSVTGLALVTIVLLDTAAYSSLNADTDSQLQQLAAQLDTRAETEVRHAYNQLRCIEVNFDVLSKEGPRLGSVLARTLEGCPTPDNADDALVGIERLDSGPRLPWEYPFFESAFFVGENGQQQWKFETSGTASNKVNVAERDYFKTIAGGHGWSKTTFCNDGDRCTFEPVLSWTVGEPRAVLAKTARVPEPSRGRPKPPVAAISILMRSLINPVLPPGFAFAVIDRTGRVLFHSDRQRILNENFFVETDNNRRLRAEVSAHSAEPLNISYWGSEYRAYLQPMQLPDMYVVTLFQKERAWAINREWLVVTLIFVAAYLVFWLTAALLTLRRNASWVWPDPAREPGYIRVSVLCVVLILIAAAGAYMLDYKMLLLLAMVLPLAGWLLSYGLLLHRPLKGRSDRREALRAYSMAAVLLLVVTGVVPGALSFVASYELHARSFIKSSQLIVARRLLDRVNRLTEEYLGTNAKAKSRRAVATQVGLVKDRDVYVDFFYGTSVTTAPDTPSSIASVNRTAAGPHIDQEFGDMVLSFLEGYLPYYSESSVEWRELLHDRSSDTSWSSRTGSEPRDGRIVFSAKQPNLSVELTSWVPSLTVSLPPNPRLSTNGDSDVAPQPVGTSGGGEDPSPTEVKPVLLVASALAIVILTGLIARVFMRRVFLVGVTEPLWACGDVAINAGENVLEIWDRTPKPAYRDDVRSLKLGPIAGAKDRARAWRQALLDHDQRAADGTVLIDDFDDNLGDARLVYNKLSLLEELAADQSRTIIMVSGVSMRTLTDSVRHSARVIAATRQKPKSDQTGASPDPTDSALERWQRLIKSFVIIERWEEAQSSVPVSTVNPIGTAPHALVSPAPPAVGATASPGWFARLRRDPVSALLASEGGKRAHPYVRRVCEDLRASKAFQNGRLTWQQAFDEIVERTKQFYRAQWESCSEDEKVVLGHIAQHGLANASVRGIVRRLLGRGLLRKDPALRPMNETFRRFILTRECTDQVAALEMADGPSTWDRLRVPLAAAVVAAGVFLFATQKELYNAIVGMTTAAAVSVPTLIRAVGMLAGRPAGDAGERA